MFLSPSIPLFFLLLLVHVCSCRRSEHVQDTLLFPSFSSLSLSCHHLSLQSKSCCPPEHTVAPILKQIQAALVWINFKLIVWPGRDGGGVGGKAETLTPLEKPRTNLPQHHWEGPAPFQLVNLKLAHAREKSYFSKIIQCLKLSANIL